MAGLGADEDDVGLRPQPSSLTAPTIGAPRVPEALAPIAAIGMPKRVRIILDDNDNIPPTGQPIGHNGRTYILVPGVEVDVPEHIIGVLNDAVVRKPIVDPLTKKTVGYRDSLRFPYRKV